MKPRCPMCKTELEGDECPKCSWKRPTGGRRASQSGHDDPGARYRKDPQCSLASGSLRCTLPAIWYPDNRKHGFCRLHDELEKQLTGPDLHEQLTHIRDHRADYMAEYYDATDWRDELMARVLGANPEWQRQPGEGRREYQQRMLAKSKALGTAVRERQHGHGEAA